MKKLAFVLLPLLELCACAARAPQTPDAAAPVAGFVTDLSAFEAFVATQPTPEQFRARYPDVLLVLPGTITTKELRLNHSRYFAQLDANSRIVGGRFQ